MPSSELKRSWLELEWYFRRQSPSLVRSYLSAKLRAKLPEQVAAFEAFMDAADAADLVLASGGGYLTDVFKRHALAVMGTLELAKRLKKPAVLLGQGLGPLRDSELLTRGKALLPTVDLITLREKRVGIPLLNELGVAPERVMTTGDDAVELAYNQRPAQMGTGIGVNIRVAKYAAIELELLSSLQSALNEAATDCQTELIPIPISRHNNAQELSDSMAIQQLLQTAQPDGEQLDTPLKVIRQAGRCRVVVTGSYHAGVFALSQGIPVIGLAKSEYYADKFLGLADQFGPGCTVVFLNDPQIKLNLYHAILEVWQAAEQLSPQLLSAAERQINLGQIAYKRICALV